MALYQRELAFREQSPQELIATREDQQLSETEKKQFPVRRATADSPDVPGQVTYPEAQAGPSERNFSPRSFWPQKSASQQRAKGRPRMPPKAPTHPLGRN